MPCWVREGCSGHSRMCSASQSPRLACHSEEVKIWAREHIANFKVPRKVVIVDSLPLTASRRVLKSTLREWLATSRLEAQK